MRRFSWTIARYTLQAVIPYFVIAWIVLSVIVFVQQAGKFSDLLFSNSIPSSLIWQLTIALIPNVVAFTSPVAVLVGVIIGLSRMQGDRETVSLRAAGVGNVQLVIPIVFLGILLSLFAFWVNLKGVPIAAQIVRRVGIQAAINRMDSPVEPGVFNHDIEGFTIYVRSGDVETGVWRDIFIYQRKAVEDGDARLITAKEGRIDSVGEDSELFLGGARILTLEETGSITRIAGEHVQDLRIQFPTKRGELIERLQVAKETPEEMGLRELLQFSNEEIGNEGLEARILFYRKLLLSITPLLFALIGFSLVTRFNRGGRGFGIFLSLTSLISYYLLALLSEQVARTGSISPWLAFGIPFGVTLFAVSWLLISQRISIGSSFGSLNLKRWKRSSKNREGRAAARSRLIDSTTGILDLDLTGNLLRNYLLVIFFLSSIFLIFTAFEMWKYAGSMENGSSILAQYLLYLMPFVYIQIAPTALMVATLATYIIKSRRNEIVVWTASGVSVFRLLLPCVILMVIVGVLNFGVQENVLPEANREQDALRDELRTRGKSREVDRRTWLASDNIVIAFQESASDNERQVGSNLSIFKISITDASLQEFIQADKAEFRDSSILLLSEGLEIATNADGFYLESTLQDRTVIEVGEMNLMTEGINKPGQLNIREMKAKMNETDSIRERRIYAISIQRKYSTVLLPLIIMLFSAPFALSLSRKGNVITLVYAIGVWLVFMGATSVFEQFGVSGYVSPTLAVWTPLALFTLVGVILLSRLRT